MITLFAKPLSPRHKWRDAKPEELRAYGSALRSRQVCTRCGIFRFVTNSGRESVTYYARMRTPSRGCSEVLKRWNAAPACPPVDVIS